MTDASKSTKDELVALLRHGKLAEFERRTEGSVADLRGADLNGANLYRANLRGADLRNIEFNNAELSDTDLRNTDLRNADLRKADLLDAVLTGANLTGANLTGADLTGADLSRTDFSGADLSGADLSGADLTTANLFEATLRGASLKQADLDRADLRGADLREADLSGADFSEVLLRGVELYGALHSAEAKWPPYFDHIAATATDDPVSDEQTPSADTEVAKPVRVRRRTLDAASQSDARIGLEPTTGHLENIYQDDPNLDPIDQAFLRTQIQTLLAQMSLEEGGNSQIIEITVAQIVRRFGDSMQLGEAEKSELIRLGANEELAEQVINHVNAMLPKFAALGDDDSEADALVLEDLAESAAEIFEELEELAPEVEEADGADKPKLGTELTSSITQGVGREIAREGGRVVFSKVAKSGGWSKVTTSLINAMETLFEALSGWIT